MLQGGEGPAVYLHAVTSVRHSPRSPDLLSHYHRITDAYRGSPIGAVRRQPRLIACPEAREWELAKQRREFGGGDNRYFIKGTAYQKLS
jgi:hypothetical protein